MSKTYGEIFQGLSNTNQNLLITFISPETKRVSPVSYAQNGISIEDLYSIEDVVNKIGDDKLPEGLDLILHTPGGDVYAATKIVKYLRSKFKKIRVFVPYEASSGGTLMALCADEIIMDDISSLTPIDPQVHYDEYFGRVSVCSYKQVIDGYEKKFGTLRETEIPPPYSQLIKKLDPIIFHEMEKMKSDSMKVAIDALKTHIKDDDERCEKIARKLVENDTIHGHVINIDEARNIGLNISKDQSLITQLKEFKSFIKWIRTTKEYSGHVVIYFVPESPTVPPPVDIIPLDVITSNQE